MPIQIINADDFGIDKEANKGITYCAQKGLINSTSVSVVNDDYLQDIDNLKKEEISLGLHINLTEGQCITNGESFTGPLDFIKSNPMKEKAFTEICNQIEKFKFIFDHYPQHLDSHQHVTYLLPSAFEAMLSAAEKFKIPIRSPHMFTSTHSLQIFLNEVYNLHNIQIPVDPTALTSKNNVILSKYKTTYRSDKILPHPQKDQLERARHSTKIHEIIVHPRIDMKGNPNSDTKLLESLNDFSLLRKKI